MTSVEDIMTRMNRANDLKAQMNAFSSGIAARLRDICNNPVEVAKFAGEIEALGTFAYSVINPTILTYNDREKNLERPQVLGTTALETQSTNLVRVGEEVKVYDGTHEFTAKVTKILPGGSVEVENKDGKTTTLAHSVPGAKSGWFLKTKEEQLKASLKTDRVEIQ